MIYLLLSIKKKKSKSVTDIHTIINSNVQGGGGVGKRGVDLGPTQAPGKTLQGQSPEGPEERPPTEGQP